MRTTFFYVKNGVRTHLKTARFCPEKDFFLSLHRELGEPPFKDTKVLKDLKVLEVLKVKQKSK